MIHGYSYACTLLIDTVIFPEEAESKIIPISTKHFDKYILQNVVANTYNSFYTINSPENIITIEKSLLDIKIIPRRGTINFKENPTSDKFVQFPMLFNDTVYGQIYNSTKNLTYSSYTTQPNGDIVYFDRPDKKRISMNNSFYVNQNEPIISHNNGGDWQQMYITSNIQNPSNINQLYLNEINLWNTNRFIQCPNKNMSLRFALRHTPIDGDDGQPIDPLPNNKIYPFLGYLSMRNLFSLNGIPADVLLENPIVTSQFYCSQIIDIPNNYDQIFIQFSNQSDINSNYSIVYFYNNAGINVYQKKFIYQNNIYLCNFSDYSGNDITKCCIQFETDQDLIKNPEYMSKIVKAYFSLSQPIQIITIPPGFYAGTEDLDLLFKMVIDAFKLEGVVVEITYNKNNGLVSIISKDTSIKKIQFTDSLNRIFGQYNSKIIEFTTNWVSPDISDLFSNGRFNCIKIHCPQLASSSFQGMSDVICQIYPSNSFGEQIISQNINFFVNFPDHLFLNSLTLIVTDNNNRAIEIFEPIYLIFQIFAYNKIDDFPSQIGGRLMHHGTMKNL